MPEIFDYSELPVSTLDSLECEFERRKASAMQKLLTDSKHSNKWRRIITDADANIKAIDYARQGLKAKAS